MGYPIVCVHVPKTMDNDLPVTDCSPGFGSVAKYLAVSMREAGYDVASMARTSTRVFILEAMGRHAGWTTAAMGLAAEADGEAPHVLLFPEIPFEQDKFLARVDATVKKHGSCVVGVSEGVQNADGKFLSDAGLRDAFGHAQLGGVAPRARQPGQGPAQAQVPLGGRRLSATRRAPCRLEDRRGAGLRGGQGRGGAGAEGQQRGHADHRAQVGQALPLEHRRGRPQRRRQRREEDAARLHQPRTASTSREKCRRYLLPLIQGEDYPPFRNGLPVYVRLKNVAVPKKLTEFKI